MFFLLKTFITKIEDRKEKERYRKLYTDKPYVYI